MPEKNQMKMEKTGLICSLRKIGQREQQLTCEERHVTFAEHLRSLK